MGPSYANLFLGYIEYQFFNRYSRGTKPELYGRYIDDCIVATSSFYNLCQLLSPGAEIYLGNF